MKGAKLCQGFFWGIVIFSCLKAIKIFFLISFLALIFKKKSNQHGEMRQNMVVRKTEKKLLGRPRAANWFSGGRSTAHQSSCQGFSSPSGVLLHSLIHRVYQAHFFPSHIWLHTWLEGVYPGTCCAEANTCLCLQVRYP